MYQWVLHAAPGTLLFVDRTEATVLWRVFARTVPELVSLVLMPDHVHLILPHADPGRRLGGALSAYARWRNHRRRSRGAAWAPSSPGMAIQDQAHLRRCVRYHHLNPCRAGLVRDPLAWPWSTHRDYVGLAAPGLVAADPQPERYHRYVSCDDSSDRAGTPFPQPQYGPVRWSEIRAAVLSVTRALPEELRRRGPARALLVRTGAVYGFRDPEHLEQQTGMARTRAYELLRDAPALGEPLRDPLLDACARAVGDMRLRDPLLERLRGWSRYEPRDHRPRHSSHAPAG